MLALIYKLLCACEQEHALSKRINLFKPITRFPFKQEGPVPQIDLVKCPGIQGHTQFGPLDIEVPSPLPVGEKVNKTERMIK